MNRRDFLTSTGAAFVAAASLPLMGFVTQTNQGTLITLGSFVRPQGSVDDLVAEYKAWSEGDMDGHDMIVARYKTLLWDEYGTQVTNQYAGHLDLRTQGTCNCEDTNMNRLDATLHRHERRLRAEMQAKMREMDYIQRRQLDLSRARKDHPDAKPGDLPIHGYHKLEG